MKDGKEVRYPKGHEDEGEVKQELQFITKKTFGSLTATDQDDLTQFIADEIKESIDNPTEAEIRAITDRSIQQYFGGPADQSFSQELAKAVILRATELKIATEELRIKGEAAVIDSQEEKKQLQKVIEREKIADHEGVTAAVLPDYQAWLKVEGREDDIKTDRIKDAIDVLDKALSRVSIDGKTLFGDGEKSNLILHFLKNNTKIGTWGIHELIMDTNEDGIINDDRFAGYMDEEITDLGTTNEDMDKIVRIIMNKTGRERYPLSLDKYNASLTASGISAGNDQIEKLQNELKHGVAKTRASRIQQKIAAIEEQQKKLDKNWVNPFAGN